jgi:hypothetical protein
LAGSSSDNIGRSRYRGIGTFDIKGRQDVALH